MAARPFPFPRDPVIELYKKDVDITLICENLKLTVEQRFERLIELQRFADDGSLPPIYDAGGRTNCPPA